jgi:hypothetical protein
MSSKSPGAALAFIVLVGIVGYGSFIEYSKPHYSSEPAKTEERDGPLSKTGPTIRTNHNHEEGKQENNWESYFDRPTDWLLVLFTAILALYTSRLYQATAGLFTATKGLESAARKQSEDTAESLRLAAIAANAAAKAAGIAERALTDAERPYVFVFGVTHFTFDPDKHYREPCVQYSVANYGKTPAIIDYITVDFFIDDSDDILFPLIDWISDHPILREPVVRPDSVVKDIMCSFDTLETIDPEDKIRLEFEYVDRRRDIGGTTTIDSVFAIPSIPNGHKLYFKVLIQYRGPFTAKHETSACWRYDEPSGRFTLEDKNRNYQR